MSKKEDENWRGKRRKPLTSLQIGTRFHDEIRAAHYKGKDLSQVLIGLNLLLGHEFEDARQYLPHVFSQAIDNLLGHLELDFNSFEALADSLFSYALSHVQSSSHIKPIRTYDQKALLAAYLSLGDWRKLSGTNLSSGLFREPTLLEPNTTTPGIKWPEFHSQYLGFPPRMATLKSRDYSSYIQPPNSTLQEFVEARIDAASGEPVTVTDIGMGEGRVVHDLVTDYGSAVSVTGVTLDNVVVPGVKVLVTPAEFLNDIPNDSQDIVLSNYASRYFLWPERVYEHIVRILKPGATALIDASSHFNNFGFTSDYDYIAFVVGDVSRERLITRLPENYQILRNYPTWQDFFDDHVSTLVGSQVLVQPAVARDGCGAALSITKL